jgi:hypothetical protein
VCFIGDFEMRRKTAGKKGRGRELGVVVVAMSDGGGDCGGRQHKSVLFPG